MGHALSFKSPLRMHRPLFRAGSRLDGRTKAKRRTSPHGRSQIASAALCVDALWVHPPRRNASVRLTVSVTAIESASNHPFTRWCVRARPRRIGGYRAGAPPLAEASDEGSGWLEPSSSHFPRRCGVPRGIRTPVSDVKSRGPGPLDDGDVGRKLQRKGAPCQSEVCAFSKDRTRPRFGGPRGWPGSSDRSGFCRRP